MRRFFPLVLMLLLVLRGLLGTAMAAGMVPALPAGGPAQQANPVQPVHQAHAPDSALAADSGLALAADHGADPRHSPAHAPCSDPAASACDSSDTHSALCSACEICHSALLAPFQQSTLPHPGTAEMRPGATAPFASAAAALAIKPPIA